MRPPTTDEFPASILCLITIFSYIATTVALTIPTTSSIELANVTGVLPLLFPSLNATFLKDNHFDPHCAPTDQDETWYSVPEGAKWRYDTTCYEALQLFEKEEHRYGGANFEFLAPGAQAATQLTPMQTPRRYSYGGSGVHWNPSCTVVVAILDFASPGQLPDQPTGPFQHTDVTSFENLLEAGGDLFSECIRMRGVGILPDLHFGWVRAGQGGNMGVFITGTKSQIDRSIPRGVHP